MDPLNLRDIQFGERDALHEYIKQDRQDIAVLDQSFVIPPRVRIPELEQGARFLIVGPKGSGKTTLLLHLQRKVSVTRTKLILFKSDIRKEDRDRLDRLVDLIVIEDQKKVPFAHDYKTVWEWYLIKTIVGLIQSEDIAIGRSLYLDIRSLMQVRDHRINTIYDNFNVETAKGKFLLGVGYGPLKSELSLEVEARKTDEKIDFLDLVRLIQNSLAKIRLKEDLSIRIYIDELEFFMSKDGDGDRDRRLVRDMIFAIDSVNRLFSTAKMSVVVIGSLRSEILNSIFGSTQEVEKIIDAFGVALNWYNDDASSHSVLGIFENKIKYSEIMLKGDYTRDVWTQYFPASIEGKSFKSYLLDIGLHRPRGVLLRLKAALELASERTAFAEEDFTKSEDIYGRYMLQEFIDEVSSVYDDKERDAIFAMLRGFSFAFDISELRSRVAKLSNANRTLGATLSKIGIEVAVRFLYRIGLIGNQFDLIDESGVSRRRANWSFRGDIDPFMEKRFVIHQSVRKTLQTV